MSSLQVGERSRSGSDLEMQVDIFETLLDRPHVETFLLMTGDRRFIRMVTMIRNRYGKNVTIGGVRGSVSNDLIEAAAGNFDPLEFEPVAAEQKRDSFVRFVDRLERSKPFITFKYVAAAMTTSIEFPGMAEEEARDFVAQAIEEGVLRKEQRSDGYRVLILNRERTDVCDMLEVESNGHPEGLSDYEDDDDYFEDEFDSESSVSVNVENDPGPDSPEDHIKDQDQEQRDTYPY
ncbi:MAG: NYN domain-containing protein [Candidatus Eisenbacteria bacterium]|uniref:NYN domain-containing protein n=1 Tax=Eiseniibacteriota bacterium TaxID=2212470 RepID=A0A7Y2H258_UNCEI|nr:NYN domain-containing protein [Candidatus Eisenbacteria bacterium]